ncbi:unnamed protein product [[Candida] boidinii]|nr:unnamed protein product [[Candida] boidinii]
MTDSDSTFDNFWKSDKNTLPDYKELNISKSKKIDLSNSSNSNSHIINNTTNTNNNNSSPAKPNHSSPSKRTPRMTLDQIAKKHANGNAEDALVNALSPKRLSKPPSQPLPPTPGQQQQQQQQQKILPSLNTEDQAEKEAIMSLMSLSSPVKKSQPFFLPQNNISTTATNSTTLTTSRKNSTSSNSSNLPSPIKQSAGFNLPISSPYHTRSISLGGTLPNQSSSLNGLNPPFAQLNQPFRTPPASSVSSFPLQQPFEHSKQIIQQQQQQPLGSQNQYSFPKMSPMRKPNLPLYNNDNEIDQDNRNTINNNGPKSPRKKRNSSSSNGQYQNITPNSFMISSPSSFQQQQQQQQQHSQSRQHSRVNSANNIVASSPGPTYPLGIHPVINNNDNLDGDDDRTASDYSD